jgi:hypothetical protein
MRCTLHVAVEEGMGCHGKLGGEEDMVSIRLLNVQNGQRDERQHKWLMYIENLCTHLAAIRFSNSIDDVSGGLEQLSMW